MRTVAPLRFRVTPPRERLDPDDEPAIVVSADEAARLDVRLQQLGVETETRRRLNRVLPWAVSAGAHLTLLAIALAITWAVATRRDAPDPVLVIGDFSAPAYAPVVAGSTDAPPSESSRVVVPPIVAPGTGSMAPDIGAPVASSPAASPPVDWSPPTGRGVSFAGVRASGARRIAYVVDASGSMIGTLPIVIDELSRSLRGLSSDQSYAVFFFQRNESIVAPPGERFAQATPDQIERTLRWIRQRVVPAGRSNPLRALESALRLRPDAIYLLSPGITGSGEFEIPQRELLDRLDAINPADGVGRRRTAILCIQFIDVDPLDTLRRIAEVHGGANGFRFLSRAELGIAPR